MSSTCTPYNAGTFAAYANVPVARPVGRRKLTLKPESTLPRFPHLITTVLKRNIIPLTVDALKFEPHLVFWPSLHPLQPGPLAGSAGAHAVAARPVAAVAQPAPPPHGMAPPQPALVVGRTPYESLNVCIHSAVVTIQ